MITYQTVDFLLVETSVHDSSDWKAIEFPAW